MAQRKLFWLIPLALLVLAILFFPALASTPLGKPLLVKILEKRLQAKVSLDQVHLSWFGPQRFERVAFSNADVEGQIGMLESNVPLWSLSDLGGSFRLQQGSFAFPAYGGGQIAEVNAKIEGSEIDATGSTPQGGHFSLKGKIYSKEDFDVVADLNRIPTGALDQLLKAKGLLYQVLGATFDLAGTVIYNRGEGEIRLDLSSTGAQTTLRASLSDNALTLKEPLTLVFHLTNELSSSLMSRINPLFLTSIQAKNPIILRIASKNFNCPLKPFSLAKLRIGNGTLDLGQMRAGSGKSLQSLLSLLKSPQTGSEIDMWFTPISFQLEGGALQMGRMDALLANSIHICTWGDINLTRDQLNMFLGLPADTLAHSFGLQNLPRSYVLKIPVRGSMKDPEIDTGAVSAKIASMVASQQLPKAGEKLFGQKGKLFGGFLNLFTQPQEDEDVPPPNRPFPWEK